MEERCNLFATNGIRDPSWAFARLIAPIHDFFAIVERARPEQIRETAQLKDQDELRFDRAIALAALENEDPKLAIVRDEELQVADQEGVLQVHVENTRVPGVYHLGVYVDGTYCPEHSLPRSGSGHEREHAGGAPTCGSECRLQSFTRLLSAATAVAES
jgi:hypothetical protein